MQPTDWVAAAAATVYLCVWEWLKANVNIIWFEMLFLCTQFTFDSLSYCIGCCSCNCQCCIGGRMQATNFSVAPKCVDNPVLCLFLWFSIQNQRYSNSQLNFSFFSVDFCFNFLLFEKKNFFLFDKLSGDFSTCITRSAAIVLLLPFAVLIYLYLSRLTAPCLSLSRFVCVSRCFSFVKSCETIDSFHRKSNA